MKSLLLVLFSLFFTVSCGDASPTVPTDEDSDADHVIMADKGNEEENITNDFDRSNDEGNGDEDVDESGDDADADVTLLQRGAVTFFEYTGSGESDSAFSYKLTQFGQGGFYGYTMKSISNSLFVIGALHESTPPYDFEKASGKLYVYDTTKDSPFDDAEVILEHPNGLINGGFSFAVSDVCDINGDGFDDIVVSAHLATVNQLMAAGQVIAFYGSKDGWKTADSSISTLSSDVLQKNDVTGQSLVCADIDGDGYADVLAGGQNAGPTLSDGGSSGMVAFFPGSKSGLAEHQSWTIVPKQSMKAVYFGASMVYADVDNDSVKDLLVGAWGAPENGTNTAVRGGAVYLFKGGEDWTKGEMVAFSPEQGKSGDGFGSVVKVVTAGTKTFLGVLAPHNGEHGSVYFYAIGAKPFCTTPAFVARISGNVPLDRNGSLSDFVLVPSSDAAKSALLVAGGKNLSIDGSNGGLLLCWDVSSDTVSDGVVCPWQPKNQKGGFGFSLALFSQFGHNKAPILAVSSPELITEK